MRLSTQFLLKTMLFLASTGAPLAQSVPQLSLKTSVDKERLQVGNDLLITVVLTNTGPTAATAIAVDSRLSVGLTFQAGTVAAPVGSGFAPSASESGRGIWRIDRLAPNQQLTLTFRAVVTDIGVVYHTAEIHGITARTCATVPVVVCSGDAYTFEITAPANEGDYGWQRTLDGSTSIIPNQRQKTLMVSSPGAYRSVLAVGQPCPDGACCPFVIEPAPDVPAYSLAGTSPTCSGTVALANGTIRLLSGSGSTTGLTFQLALGSGSLDVGNLLTPKPQPIPATGLLSTNLTGGLYQVRVANAAGCFRDGTATVPPANCTDCPPAKCVPFVIRQTKRAERIGSR